jgi:predicted RNase H-like HicB family nuclease
MKYLVVIEKNQDGYWVWVPDLPGCVSVGDTPDEARRNIHEAIDLHLEGMREDGQAIPSSTMSVVMV